MDKTVRHRKSAQPARFFSDGKFAIGLTAGLSFGMLAFAVLSDFWSGWDTSEIVASILVLVSLFVASASLFVAAMALYEQRKTREAGTDPVVLLHFGQRDDARAMVTFCISNVGAGAALNVALDVEAPDDDLSNRNLITDIFSRHHPFRVLKQNDTIEFNLTMGWNLLGHLPLPPFDARVEYEDIDGNQYEAQFTMDILEMSALGSHDSADIRTTKALEMIAKSHEAIAGKLAQMSKVQSK